MVRVLVLRVSPRLNIFFEGHRRLSPFSVWVTEYTSSAYSTLIPSATIHIPSRNFMIKQVHSYENQIEGARRGITQAVKH